MCAAKSAPMLQMISYSMVSKACSTTQSRISIVSQKRWTSSNIIPALQKVPAFGSFKRALTRQIAACLRDRALRLSNSNAVVVNMELAVQQHCLLKKALVSAGVVIDELPSDDLADSVFIEDTVVIVGDTAMVTNPGAASRRAETTRVRKVLEMFHSSDLKCIQQTEGTLDGGDVLFTGEDTNL